MIELNSQFVTITIQLILSYIYIMKKILLYVIAISFLCSCAIFRKKEKYGCPNDARGKSQEEMRDAGTKTKYKGGKKF